QPGGRVLVLLTDGNDVGSQASVDDALSSRHHAGAVVYPVAFGSKADASGLKRLASQTGGSFHGAAAGGALTAIYSSIARELRRTWRVRYLTTARPGDKLDLKASVGRLGADHRSVAVPDPNGEAAAGSKPSPILPSPLYGKLGDLFLTLLAAIRILAEGWTQLQGGHPERCRRGPRARCQGTPARPHGHPARPADGGGAPGDCRANRLEELLVRDHSRQHPAAGRRLSRRTVRHGRRHRSRPATVRAQDPLADR